MCKKREKLEEKGRKIKGEIMVDVDRSSQDWRKDTLPRRTDCKQRSTTTLIQFLYLVWNYTRNFFY